MNNKYERESKKEREKKRGGGGGGKGWREGDRRTDKSKLQKQITYLNCNGSFIEVT